MQFEINAPAVVEELIDGEIVAVQLETGHYYSLVDEACAVWTGLKAGWTVDQISARLDQLASTESQPTQAAVSTFVAELLAEQLIRAGAGLPRNEQALDEICAKLSARTFAAPLLQKYTDMQELLLLDPVHEVGATGWPAPAPDNTK